MMIYGDKRTTDLTAQSFKLQGGRKVATLVKEEINHRELENVKYDGLRLNTCLVTTDSEAKMISDEMEELCVKEQWTQFKSPPRSHKFNFIEGRITVLKAKALALFHWSGFPLTLYLHAVICACAVISTRGSVF